MTPRESLLDFFDDRIRSAEPFLVYDDGYRAETRSYAEVRAGAERFAARLAAAGCRPDDKVVLWGENRPEWIAAFWGCLLARAVVVPLDVRTSADLLARVADRVRARIVVVGDEAPAVAPAPGTVHWRLAGLFAPAADAAAGPPPPATPPAAGGDLARDHLHLRRDRRPEGRRDHPREPAGEHRAGGARGAEVREVRPALLPAAVPEPPPAQPPLRPGDGHLRPADAGRGDRLHARLRPGGDRAPDSDPPGVRPGVRPAHPRSAARRAAAGGPGDRAGGGRAEAARRRPLVAAPPDAPAVRHEVLGVRRRRGSARPGAAGVLVAPGLPRRPGLRADGDGSHRHREPPLPHAAGVGRDADRRGRGGHRRRRRDPGPGRQRDPRLLRRPGGDGGGVPRRLAAHRRRRVARRGRPPDGARAQEGDDRHPRRPQRLPGGRRARARHGGRGAGGGGRGRVPRRPGARARGAGGRGRARTPTTPWARPTGAWRSTSASGAARSGRRRRCPARRAPGSSAGASSPAGSPAAGRLRAGTAPRATGSGPWSRSSPTAAG